MGAFTTSSESNAPVYTNSSFAGFITLQPYIPYISTGLTYTSSPYVSLTKPTPVPFSTDYRVCPQFTDNVDNHVSPIFAFSSEATSILHRFILTSYFPPFSFFLFLTCW